LTSKAIVQLRKLVIWRFSAEILEMNKAFKPRFHVDYTFLVNNENPLLHQVAMEIKLVQQTTIAPIKLDVRASAFFEFDEGATKDTIDNTLPGNCLPMTYSSLRGIVLSNTSAMGMEPFLIPSVNFRELEKKKIRAEKRRAKKASSEAKKGSGKKRKTRSAKNVPRKPESGKSKKQAKGKSEK